MINFTKQLLKNMQESPDTLQMYLDRLSQESALCIWGTGVAGQMIFATAKKLGIHIDSFIDGTLCSKSQNYLLNKPIITPDKIPSTAFIIIAANVKYGIHRLIDNYIGNEYCYIDPLLFSQYSNYRKMTITNILKDAEESINLVYSQLHDEMSKRTFRNVIEHQVNHRLDLLWDVLETNQYFGNDVIPLAYGSFVDCGAYTGDTLRAFLAQIENKDYLYYAFEPEHYNYVALHQFVENGRLENVRLRNIGLWNSKACLRFIENKSNDNLAWKLAMSDDEKEACIHVDSLDNQLRGNSIDFIKMDIEGSELMALDGSKECLQTHKPKLAISAYHQIDHLWKVPLKMLELNPSYKLFFRHHSWNMADTVCYGV